LEVKKFKRELQRQRCKICNASSTLVRFENKKDFFSTLKNALNWSP
jgi:hypothetical protein